MKRQILAVALGSLFALPALANNEIDTGYAGTPQVTTQSANEVFVNAEQGYEFLTASMSDKSRAEVVAEVAQARRSGDFILNAELGTKASSQL
jgi:hypothetical protein